MRTSSRSLFQQWRLGLVGALLFLIGYVGPWEATQAFVMRHGVAPLLDIVAARGGANLDAVVQASARTISVWRTVPATSPPGDAATPNDDTTRQKLFTVHLPGGIRLLLSGLVIIFLTPCRPYWLYLGGLHAALVTVCVGLLCIALLGGTWALDGAAFVTVYLADAASLLFVVGVVLHRQHAAPLRSPN